MAKKERLIACMISFVWLDDLHEYRARVIIGLGLPIKN
jgi:hypothetical protein